MTPDISMGLKHYLLILTPSLIAELNDFGHKWAASDPHLNTHDVDKAFFAARAIERRLPRQPELAEPEVWLDIMKAIHAIRRVLDVLEKDTFDAVAEEARKTTSDIARADIQRAFERKRAKGEIDFRLHGLSKSEPVDDGADPVVRESFQMKRAGRYRALMDFDGQNLKPEERVILQDAKALARRIVEEQLEDSRIDALLVMAAVLMETASVKIKTYVPGVIKESFDRMTRKAAMALGAIVYRDEYQQLKALLELAPLDSDP